MKTTKIAVPLMALGMIVALGGNRPALGAMIVPVGQQAHPVPHDYRVQAVGRRQ